MNRPQGELLERASEVADRLFTGLVDEYLAGKDPGVVVTWSDQGETDTDGTAIESPTVTIGGVNAPAYAKRIMEWSTSDQAFMEAAGNEFQDTTGMLWDDTIKYYQELRWLGPEMDLLAVSKEAGFFDKAKSDLEKSGITGVGDGEIVTTARRLACEALVEWSEAVEDTKEQARDEFNPLLDLANKLKALLDSGALKALPPTEFLEASEE